MNEHDADEVSDLLDFEGAELFVPDDVPDHLQDTKQTSTEFLQEPSDLISTGLIRISLTILLQLLLLIIMILIMSSCSLQ